MFVIVDLEWITNDDGHYEPTQLAAVKVNADWSTISEFSAFIKPRNIAECDWSHPAYTGGNCEDFANAKAAYLVLNSFNEWLDSDDILLWWHYEAKKVYRRLDFAICKRSGPNKSVILDSYVYSELKGQFSSTGSPYKIAAAREIQVDVRLHHYAKNDVRVLRELLELISFPQNILLYPTNYQKGQNIENVGLPYQYHKETNTIHKKDCEKIKQNDVETIGYYTLEIPVKKSFVICDCCKDDYKMAIIERKKNFIEKAGYNYIYSLGSKVYHKPTCRYGLSAKNIIGAKYFKAVIKSGRRPCEFCKPSSFDERRKHNKREIISSQIKSLHTPPNEEKKAILRQKMAIEERQKELSNIELTEEQKKDIYTLTQPGFAFWVGKGYQSFHMRNCHKLKGLSNLKGFSTYKEAVRAGFTPCKYCKPTKKNDAVLSIPITSCVRENESIDDIVPFCESAGYTYHKDDEYFYIKTPVGKWKIVIDSKPIKLEHINLTMDFNEWDYHIQPRRFLSFTDAVEYIKRHDDALMKKPVVV